MERVRVVLGHLASSPKETSVQPVIEISPCGTSMANSDDIVVVHGLRTAIGRAKRGSFKVRRARDVVTVFLEGGAVNAVSCMGQDFFSRPTLYTVTLPLAPLSLLSRCPTLENAVQHISAD